MNSDSFQIGALINRTLNHVTTPTFIQYQNYIWPFEHNHEADVAPCENKFDTLALDAVSSALSFEIVLLFSKMLRLVCLDMGAREVQMTKAFLNYTGSKLVKFPGKGE